ncbi:DUF397 domain-containing protein [Streptomyces sp. JB150]|uniref:DUF397 domain-containing protein n=1 Tax=Streptomyces sp. JB150 TaxID=2714844 RepID=UPI0014078FC7|nr:DUF397 domain-containing protein [Streptomyces sp. JB150]QIJ62798.1 DUF397 domain-containing protein [Streptomyces sp. JB150]
MTDRAITNAATLNGWRKSSYSGPEADRCLEVLDHHPTGIPVRDSKNPAGPAVVFPAAGWALFVRAVGNGTLPV